MATGSSALINVARHSRDVDEDVPRVYVSRRRVCSLWRDDPQSAILPLTHEFAGDVRKGREAVRVAEIGWTNAQHGLVRDVIAEEVERARLSHKFIPEVKLAEDARSVQADKYDSENDTVDDVTTIPLVEVSACLKLTKLQAEDSDLSAALLLIRRAANRLARAHDAIVFAGQPMRGQLPANAPQPPSVIAIGGEASGGVSGAESVINIDPAGGGSYGERLVERIAEALVQLEAAGYIGSYVLILGQRLFTDANTPSPGSLVLPRDRLEALLAGGPVHRSSVLDQNAGLLMSLGGEPVDRTVAVAPRFEFLRIGDDDARECRVFERFNLRLKESASVVRLARQDFPPEAGEGDGDG